MLAIVVVAALWFSLQSHEQPMQEAVSGRALRLTLAQAEADLIQLENEKAEADADLTDIKAKLAFYNRQQILGAVCAIFIVTIVVILPFLLFLMITKGQPLARRLKETEAKIASLLTKINAKRGEIARVKVELAALEPVDPPAT